MRETLTLTGLDQLKAVADPLRQRILECLSRTPATTKQVADQLGEKPTRLYHHVNALERAGLIELVETRQNRGTVEKYYAAVARQLAVDHRLLSMVPHADEVTAELHASLVNTLRAGLSDARASFDADRYASDAACLPAVAGNVRVRVSEVRAREFTERLQELLRCFEQADDDGEVPYSLTLAFYPTKPPNERQHS